MALNTYYPNYNNPYQQQYYPNSAQAQQMQQIQQQTAQPSICWVSGDREAAAYPVAPNNAVALWSQTEPVVYLKQADATGKPSMKIYDLVERSSVSEEEKAYATKDELGRIREEIDKIKSEMSSKKKPVKRWEEDDE